MLASLFLLVACGGASTDTAASGADGATLYASNCASCHGDDGEGVSAPAMTLIVPDMMDEAIADAIANGTDGGMPAFTFDDAETSALVTYLRDTFGG
jgi:mono/diheme cytochrome c family protein